MSRSQDKQHILTALARGQALGREATAIFLPGEDIRCPRQSRAWIAGADSLCGAYLYTQGPESSAYVRPYDLRQFNERRRTHRGNHRCPRCEGRLEIETHLTAESAA